MTPKRNKARKWINLCVIVTAIVAGLYFIAPSLKPQREFIYEGKMYTLDDMQPQQQSVQLAPEQERTLYNIRERCRIAVSLRFGARHQCDE